MYWKRSEVFQDGPAKLCSSFVLVNSMQVLSVLRFYHPDKTDKIDHLGFCNRSWTVICPENPYSLLDEHKQVPWRPWRGNSLYITNIITNIHYNLNCTCGYFVAKNLARMVKRKLKRTSLSSTFLLYLLLSTKLFDYFPIKQGWSNKFFHGDWLVWT